MKHNLNIKYLGNNLSQGVVNFVETNHYSNSCRSQKQIHVFTLHSDTNRMIGVAIYGSPISRNSSEDAIELRRFCLDDSREKNTASYFLSRTLLWLKSNEFRFTHVVTYADPNVGHRGTIYKATNFIYDGLENNNPRIIVDNQGNKYHTRVYYQKKDGVYDNVALRLQSMVDKGEARIIQQERKLRFIYKLR